MNDLAGKPLRYLIGADAKKLTGEPGCITMVPYGAPRMLEGISAGYCNARLGDLTSQFKKRKQQVFDLIELDNASEYPIKSVLGAIELAGSFGLRVLAKNPLLFDWTDALCFIRHPNVHGIIVEMDAGELCDYQILRYHAHRLTLPIWFVSHGDEGLEWIESVRDACCSRGGVSCIGATHSAGAVPYGDSVDILRPVIA